MGERGRERERVDASGWINGLIDGSLRRKGRGGGRDSEMERRELWLVSICSG